MTPAVEFRGAAVAGRLAPLDLTVARGETRVLLGRSGSGKTTALKLVNALLRPDAGDVRIDGVSATAADPIELRRRTGYVIQEVGLLPHLDVAANVGLVPSLLGWPPARIAERIEEMLALVGLARFGARMPRELSGGQRQRVGIARALAAEPPLLLMDEPFGALDPITRAELRDEFAALRARLGTTVLLVTHDVREALRLATRIAVLRDGRLVADGTPDDLARSDDGEVRALLATA